MVVVRVIHESSPQCPPLDHPSSWTAIQFPSRPPTSSSPCLPQLILPLCDGIQDLCSGMHPLCDTNPACPANTSSDMTNSKVLQANTLHLSIAVPICLLS